MGVKKLRSIFLKYAIFLALDVILVISINIGIYLFGVNKGFIYPFNKINTEIESTKPLLQSLEQITEYDIPPLCKYARFTEDGSYVGGSIGAEEAASIWKTCIENSQTSSNRYFCTVIDRDSEILILRYRTSAQFKSPLLQSIFPSADLLLIVVIFLELLSLLVAVSYLFGKYLEKKMDKLLIVAQKIEHQDLNFEIEKSHLFEIDQALDALEHMKHALKKSLSEQWEADKMRQGQISALAHDLKTPLTIIRGNAELLCDTNLSEGQRECADYIKNSSIQVQSYVQTLIEVTRTWNSYQLQFHATDISTFLREVENQAKGLCAVKGIQFQWNCNYKSQEITIDYDLLMRALINILSNAVEHTPPTGIVTFEIFEKESKLFFAITDTGNGFTDAALKHATEQFFMDDASRNSKSHFGIGLYVANSVCEKHGGRLLLENTSATGGAKVTLIIPLNIHLTPDT